MSWLILRLVYSVLTARVEPLPSFLSHDCFPMRGWELCPEGDGKGPLVNPPEAEATPEVTPRSLFPYPLRRLCSWPARWPMPLRQQRHAGNTHASCCTSDLRPGSTWEFPAAPLNHCLKWCHSRFPVWWVPCLGQRGSCLPDTLDPWASVPVLDIYDSISLPCENTQSSCTEPQPGCEPLGKPPM